MEISAPQASLAASTAMLDRLVEKLSHFSIFDLTWTQKAVKTQESQLDMINLSELETPSDVRIKDLSHLPLRIRNLDSIF